MNDLIPFNFESNNIRVVMQGEEPWFVVSDVCTILEHTNVSVAVDRLDSDEKRLFDPKQYLGSVSNQLFWAVNESGLYSLIFTSRKPEAKRFRKWVTNEVLPSIRKTGGYQLQQASGTRMVSQEALNQAVTVALQQILSEVDINRAFEAAARKTLTEDLWITTIEAVNSMSYAADRVIEDMIREGKLSPKGFTVHRKKKH